MSVSLSFIEFILIQYDDCLLNDMLSLSAFLISELEASRMILVNKPQKAAQEAGGSVVFMELKGICVSLGMSKPPANITMFQFFSGIEKKVSPCHTRLCQYYVMIGLCLFVECSYTLAKVWFSQH